ncbi:hypothetical protein EBX93_18265 [bacterium]|nr:hypothetical protein [bacterium]
MDPVVLYNFVILADYFLNPYTPVANQVLDSCRLLRFVTSFQGDSLVKKNLKGLASKPGIFLFRLYSSMKLGKFPIEEH